MSVGGHFLRNHKPAKRVKMKEKQEMKEQTQHRKYQENNMKLLSFAVALS